MKARDNKMPGYSAPNLIAIKDDGTLITPNVKSIDFINGNVIDNGNGNLEVDLSSGIPTLDPQWVESLEFSFNSPSPINVYEAKTGETVISQQIIITEEFDDPAATLEFGDAGNPARHIAANENEPTTVAEYAIQRAFKYLADTQTILTINPGASTQGKGIILLQVDRP
jgi:hypothetical protein